jgi:hypothetical protein
MATGVAYGLYSQWPKVKQDYEYWYDKRSVDFKHFNLGEIQIVQVNKSTIVINMIAQKLGTDIICGKEIPPIRLWALKECIMKVRDFMMVNKDYKIIAPKFGSLRAGGDFDRDILPMIEKYWGDFDVTICEFEE